MTLELDTVVVGAGAVGLAVAVNLAKRGHDVTLIERHLRAGMETSSRSSEVIHAGLYYAAGSLKARLCVAGRELTYAFCSAEEVTFRQYGKLIVATSADQLPALNRLAATAEANGVPGLELWCPKEVRHREPEINCVAALFSPRTGVMDSAAFVAALERRCIAAGVTLAFATEVAGIARLPAGGFDLHLVTNGEVNSVRVRRLIIAAGHGAAPLAREAAESDTYRVPACRQAKGHYFALRGAPPFRTLVYPVPEPASLGIHLTLDVSGAAKFGPDLQWQDGTDLSFDEAGGARQAAFEASIRGYWPGLPDNALVPAYVGLRPKLHGPGEPAADFLIDGPAEHGVDNLVVMLGIESPGLTAALAIGPYVARLLNGG